MKGQQTVFERVSAVKISSSTSRMREWKYGSRKNSQNQRPSADKEYGKKMTENEHSSKSLNVRILKMESVEGFLGSKALSVSK